MAWNAPSSGSQPAVRALPYLARKITSLNTSLQRKIILQLGAAPSKGRAVKCKFCYNLKRYQGVRMAETRQRLYNVTG
ncbi:hypothetical protein C2W62_15585 [Candidatus Entotheonella serta]|nr:hypothetical protein C2W62_15585 [Candidatus Entotheonella serta]